ncbi:hypothetical protein Ato02nite_027460 [Paractinoplanes toevensis]|uniref:Uncharacterized protein n=1 Tax=Paractinoplanes toevensis TaxID=571911 RepID=A0A919T894_9ACTN|nr:hypothetical protein Ato02nite_027460 [Actinoplanes toevensis]
MDRIIARQRHRQGLSRVAAGGAAALGVVLAVAAGVSLTGGTTRPAPLPAASPTSKPVGFILQTRTEAGRQETLDRLRTALENSTRMYAPGAAWIFMPDVPGAKRTPDGHPIMWANTPVVTFEGRSGIVAGGRKGGFFLSVRPIGIQSDGTSTPMRECDGSVAVCESTRTPKGLDLVHWIDRPQQLYTLYGTQIRLRGGNWSLTLQAVNYFGGDPGRVSADRPALTRSQLDAIATEMADLFAG